MTDDRMNLRTLAEKSPDCDLLREMIGFAAERLMELEVGAATGASPTTTAIVRLVVAILLEQNDEWAVQRARYMTLETISQMNDDRLISLPALTR